MYIKLIEEKKIINEFKDYIRRFYIEKDFFQLEKNVEREM